MNNISKIIALTLSTLLLLVACNKSAPISKEQKNTPEQIIVTTQQYLFEISEILLNGTEIKTINLTKNSPEPHDFEPTPSDSALLESSNLIIANSPELEPYLKNQSSKIFFLSKNVEKPKLEIEHDGITISDPHFWLDPILYENISIQIAKKLSVEFPSKQETINKNLASFLEKTNELKSLYESGLKNCKQKIFFTNHNAFNYLAKRYNLMNESIHDLSPEHEISLKHLKEVIQEIKSKNINYILIESNLPTEIADTIAKETSAKTMILNPFETLSTNEISLGKNYFSEMKLNLENLKIALSCE